ncbi:MAG: NADP-dependent isocitrate dehydrogenase, partial [Lachnospiraceae bacterium]|nr:NADP-dependent isocitrate dehydrogenase [Lachnospiraceae bacterium]
WSGALRKRGELDNLPELVHFADCLEKASLDTIASGHMTKDLALLADMEDKHIETTEGFILKIKENLEKLLAC